MKFHIITIFPEAFDSFMSTSIIKKALDNKLFDIELYKLNDFSEKNFKQVDDKAYGMHGQVISPEPLAKAINFVVQKIKTSSGEHMCSSGDKILEDNTSGQTHRSAPTDSQIPIIYMSPAGTLLKQDLGEQLSQDFLEKDIIIICGHYEGIDGRIIEKYVTHEISIGEYVLTNGELSAQVLIDSLVRHIPNVIGNIQSVVEESFSVFFNRQKEHFVYTRPRIFESIEVPSVLFSGNHKKIEQWKQDNAR